MRPGRSDASLAQAMTLVLAATLSLTGVTLPASAAENPISAGISGLQTIGRVLRGDFELVPITQAQFDSVSGDLGAAADLRSGGAALPLGHGRFALNVRGDRTATDDPALWTIVSGKQYRALSAPRLGLAVGLGERLNVELAAMLLPGQNARVLNAAASLSLLGNAADIPHLALRGSVGHLAGIDDVRIRTTGLELIVAQRMGPILGYAGAGAIVMRARYNGDTPLRSHQALDKWFVGIEGGSVHLRAALETGQTEGRDYQGIRLSYFF